MTNAKKRLEEVEMRIKSLKEQLQNAENEKFELLKEIYDSEHEVIDAMPARVQNALRISGITNDLTLKHFLDGEFKKDSDKYCFSVSIYESAETREERLMTLRDVGNKLASDAVLIATAKGL